LNKVLILGPSNVHFAEPGEEATTTFNLLRNQLARSAPSLDCEVATGFLTYGERMAERAVELIEREQADVTFIQVGTSRLEDTYVVYMIRKRWPSMYPRAMRFAIWLKELSGGGTHGGEGPRGLLFRVPRAIARAIIGAETGYPIDDAIKYTAETVDAVARFEDRSVAIHLMPTTRKSPSRQNREMVARFSQEVRQQCANRRVDFLARADYCRELGRGPYFTRQGIYPSLEQRQVDAEAMTAYMLKSLGREAQEASAAAAD
jgi:hypothetical protein